MRLFCFVAAAIAVLGVAACKKKVALGNYPGSYSVHAGSVDVSEKDTTVEVTGSGDKVTMTILGCALDGTQLGDNKVKVEADECTLDVPGAGKVKAKFAGDAMMDTAGGLLTIDVKDGKSTLEFSGMLNK